MYSSNPTVDVTINDLELGSLAMQILIFAPRMVPMVHIHTYINNTASHGWAHRGSSSKASSVGPILWELSLMDRRKHIHTSVGRVPGEDNKMAGAALWITHLPDQQFFPTSAQNSHRASLGVCSLCHMCAGGI